MLEISVLDKGFVRLDGVLASDLSVVNAARVSFAKRVEEMGESDEGLIRYLMKNRHGTPFEHNTFRFHAKMPIFVARELMRHRMSSINEWSARYSKLEGEFYLPESENVRTQVGKPGAYTFNVLEEQQAADTREQLEYAYRVAWDTYEELLDDGVAKELARLCLPVAIYTQFYWTINARSLMNFLSLRNSEHAMYEIRQYAIVIEEIFAEAMPVTHAAFIENGRVAP